MSLKPKSTPRLKSNSFRPSPRRKCGSKPTPIPSEKPRKLVKKPLPKRPLIEKFEKKDQEQNVLRTIVKEAGREAIEKAVVGGACAAMPALAPAFVTAYNVYRAGQALNSIRKTYSQLDDSTKRRLSAAVLRGAAPEAVGEAVAAVPLKDAVAVASRFAEVAATNVMRTGATDNALTALGMTPNQKALASRIVSRTFSGIVKGSIEGTLKGAIKVAMERMT